jgi:hypothetical protein
MGQKLSYYASLSYALFPSVLYYVGTLFWYEQIVLSMLIIAVYYLLKIIKENITYTETISMCMLVILSSLLRIQTIAIFIPLLTFLFFYLLKKSQYQKSFICIFIVLIGFAAHFPSLSKNKSIYGKYILSTQTGYEILQGHNPYAKGSWMGDWLLPSSALYQYSHQNIKDIAQLNQYEEGLARKNLAFSWIKENPFAEIKLIFRKMILFFLPRNFEFLPLNQFLNPVNFIFYAGFIAYLFLTILKKMTPWDFEKTMILLPILGSLALTLIFFMGARWRYYAEPFMIIFAMLAFREIRSEIILLKNKFDGFQK